ncbi:hypothetical protein DH2020_023634 [Rehmannia glutinosa]|uniref:Uncharacterized protein n=1 Tax=Rehmannia glutinosa TaxID=99300 RepID=A0ABR0W6L6_REHGL
MHDHFMGLDNKYEHLTNTLASIQLQLLNLNKGKGQLEEESILGGPYPASATEGSHPRAQHSPRTRLPVDHSGVQLLSLLPRHDFPRFDGTHPHSWILKCTCYFRLGCLLETTKPLLVKVANGQKMVSCKKATNAKWLMQGTEFTYSLRLLENEGCDLILGGDWIKPCTPIEVDYDKMTFTVTLLGKRVTLQALTSTTDCQMITGHSLYDLMHSEFLDEVEMLYLITPPVADFGDHPALLTYSLSFKTFLKNLRDFHLVGVLNIKSF